MIDTLGLAFYDFDQCAYCKRPDDWDASQGDVRTLKATRLISNNTYLQGLVRKCADVVKHQHRAVIGKSTTGISRSADAGAYAPLMATTYASCVRTPWLRGVQPTPRPDLPHISINMLSRDIALDPAKISSAASGSNVTNAPMTVGGASASGNPTPPVRAPGDHWTETPDTWIRMHVVPRFTMCYPPDEGVDGPKSEELGPIRVTHMVFSDTTRDTRS